jgi:hypothetical protein
MSAQEAWEEYATVLQGIELGYLCPADGAPCEFETYHELYGQDADGNRGVWVSSTRCLKCGEYDERR